MRLSKVLDPLLINRIGKRRPAGLDGHVRKRRPGPQRQNNRHRIQPFHHASFGLQNSKLTWTLHAMLKADY